MNKIESFEQFIVNQSQYVSPLEFGTNLFAAVLLAFLLSKVYERYGNPFSLRESFSKIFVPLTLITMIVITIVKTSLALSLGLVGALSIVRFRAAIKDPEELVYLFFCIAIGLGFGANQSLITIGGALFGFAVIFLQYKLRKVDDQQNLFITINAPTTSENTLIDVTKKLEDSSRSLSLRRLDDSKGSFEASYNIKFNDINQLDKCVKDVKQAFPESKINVIENLLR